MKCLKITNKRNANYFKRDTAHRIGICGDVPEVTHVPDEYEYLKFHESNRLVLVRNRAHNYASLRPPTLFHFLFRFSFGPS